MNGPKLKCCPACGADGELRISSEGDYHDLGCSNMLCFMFGLFTDMYNKPQPIEDTIIMWNSLPRRGEFVLALTTVRERLNESLTKHKDDPVDILIETTYKTMTDLIIHFADNPKAKVS